jgi:hypothetical protein
LTATILGAVIAASTVSAQQFLPSAGARQERSAASVSEPAPGVDPIVGMAATRGARYLLRNGLDYINYQEYDRALRYLREAENRQKELSDPEKLMLKQGIERAQRGLREAIGNERPYALSQRTGRPSTFAPAKPTVQMAAARPAATPPPPRAMSREGDDRGEPIRLTGGEVATAALAAGTAAQTAAPPAEMPRPLPVGEIPGRLSEVKEAPPLLADDRPQAAAEPPQDTPGTSSPDAPAPAAGKPSGLDTSAAAAQADLVSPLPSLEPNYQPGANDAPQLLPGQNPQPQAQPVEPSGQPAGLAPPPAESRFHPGANDAPQSLPRQNATFDAQPSAPVASGAAASPATAGSQAPAQPSAMPDAVAPAMSEPVAQARPEEAAGPSLIDLTSESGTEKPEAAPPVSPITMPGPAADPAGKGQRALDPKAVGASAAPEDQAAPSPLSSPMPSPAPEPGPALDSSPAPINLEPPGHAGDQPAEGVRPEVPSPSAADEGAIPLPPLGGDPLAEPKPAASPALNERPDAQGRASEPAPLPPPAGIDLASPELPPLPTGDTSAAQPTQPAQPTAVSSSSRELPLLPGETAQQAEPKAETLEAPLPAAANELPSLPGETPSAAAGQPKPGPAAEAPLATGGAPTDAGATPLAAEAVPAQAPANEAPSGLGQDPPAAPLTGPASELTPTPGPSPRPEAPAPSAEPSAVPADRPLAADATGMKDPSSTDAGPVVPQRVRSTPIELRPDLQREVEEIARRQEEALQGAQARPGAPADGREAGGVMSTNPELRSQTQVDISRAPSPAEARPIRAIPVPEDWVPLARRQWSPQSKYWAAAATCHLPLYFQDAMLERYGHSVENYFGPAGRYMAYPVDRHTESTQRNQMAQPWFSAGLFAWQIITWPYALVVDPPWEAQYDLGYWRPGDQIPTDLYYQPLTGTGPPLRGRRY